MRRRVLSLLLALCLLCGLVPMGVTASAKVYTGECGEDAHWELDSDKKELRIFGTGPMADYGYPEYSPWSAYAAEIDSAVIEPGITTVGESTFYDLEALKEVSLPETVTFIKNLAIADCRSLYEITLPSKLEKIGEDVFYGCDSLTRVHIPPTVQEIKKNPFRQCANLQSIQVDSRNSNYLDIDGVLYTKDMKTIVCCPNGKEGEFKIPEGVEIIEEAAFQICDKITAISIPDGVTKIRMGAFSGCSSLTRLILPDGVKSIGGYAFQNCTSLEELVIPDGVTSIGGYAFDCTNLTSLTLPSGLTVLEGGSLFYGCTNVTHITIPNTITEIGLIVFEWLSDNVEEFYFVGTEEQWNEIGGAAALEFAIEEGSLSSHVEVRFGNQPPPPKPAPEQFEDVQSKDWFADSVTWAIHNNITSGKGSTTTFKPHDTCTRAEIMTFIWAAEGRPDPAGAAEFSDMPSLPAFRSAISWAVEQGVTSGMGGGKFGAAMPCTRVQAVTFLWAAAGKPQPNATATFSDMTGNPVYDAAISWAVENQITTGAGNNRFAPGKRCTRAEIVTFLRNAYQ